MSRLTLCVTSLILVLLLASCERNEPPWKKLPSSSSQSYEVSIRTFKDGEYADQPFHVRVISKDPRASEIGVMKAQQCKNVNILQGQDFLYFFYEELSLSGFSSSKFSAAMPRPFLCPLQHEFCRNMLKGAISEREMVASACSYS